ncbi:HK97-gp10 family putative phage morphogenesis protein [Nitrososphaera sp.]|uniref:HK97-gp10 family putative phage morphogenesis protein n=1 Tax=Nitrososphaera sp. TaxID=1971748 RepID=UPI00307E2549
MTSIRVKGAKEAAQVLRDFAASIDQVIEEDVKKIAPPALEHANSLTPVRTGYLRSRNQVSVDGKTLTLGNDAPYARLVHDGTSRQMPQPFISPVREELARLAPGIVSQDLAEAYEKARGKKGQRGMKRS